MLRLSLLLLLLNEAAVAFASGGYGGGCPNVETPEFSQLAAELRQRGPEGLAIALRQYGDAGDDAGQKKFRSLVDQGRTVTAHVPFFAAIITLLQLAGASDAIVLVDGSGTEIMSRLYTERGGLGPARPVGDDVQAVLRPLRPLPRVKPPPDPPPVIKVPLPPATPWYQERWAKVSLGVGTTAVVVGVITAILLRDPGSSTLMPTIEVD